LTFRGAFPGDTGGDLRGDRHRGRVAAFELSWQVALEVLSKGRPSSATNSDEIVLGSGRGPFPKAVIQATLATE
jgi:hypothetical protein